jgi:YegS/Rv2252/BmrU family lipid kinase
MFSLIFIGNPVAGKGKTLKRWPELEKAIREKGWTYDIRWTTAKGEGRVLARKAISENPDLIVSFGGDGTAHEVINGIKDNNQPGSKTGFTVFPIGTGNDWARYWKIPRDLSSWIRMVEKLKLYDHDLGQIELLDPRGRPPLHVFNNVAGAAYDAYVADYIETKQKKMKGGGLQYLWFIFRCLFSYKLQPSRLTWPGGRAEDYFYTINIGMCPFSGGGLHLVPHAKPDQGLMAVTAVRPIPRWRVVLLTPLFYSGTLLSHPKVLHFKTKELLLEPGNPAENVKLEAEGEFLGNLPARLTVLIKALKICAP